MRKIKDPTNKREQKRGEEETSKEVIQEKCSRTEECQTM